MNTETPERPAPVASETRRAGEADVHPSVLVTGDDETAIREYADHITSATGIRAGLCADDELVTRVRDDVVRAAVIQRQQPRAKDLDLVGVVKSARPDCRILVVTAFSDAGYVIEAIRQGALRCISSPKRPAALARWVRLALDAGGDDRPSPRAHAAARWAVAVAQASDLASDPRTVALWGRRIGVAPSTLRAWCRVAGIPTKRSLDLARLLRLIKNGRASGSLPTQCLDVADRRTLVRLMSVGGLEDASGAPDVEQFLDRQTLVRDAAALFELHEALMALHPSR